MKHSTLCVAPATDHVGYSWVAILDDCGCADVQMKPLANHAIDAFGGRRDAASRMDLPAQSGPLFTPEEEWRAWKQSKLTGAIR